jgi:threonine aldolase
MGSVLAGSAEFIQRARVFRRMVGGGLRQAGIMAAAGLVALDSMTARLADDHRRARRLWELLHAIDPALVNADAPHTNILHLHAGGGDAYAWEKELSARGILARATNRRSLRLVTHRHIGDADIDAMRLAIAGMHDRDQTH